MVELEMKSPSPEEIEGVLNKRTCGAGFEPLRAQGVVPLQMLKLTQWKGGNQEWLKNPSLQLATVICEKVDTFYPTYTIKWPSFIDMVALFVTYVTWALVAFGIVISFSAARESMVIY